MNRRLKYRFILLLLLVCALLLLAACNGTDITAPEKKAPVVSAPPPNTTYPMPPLENASINNLGWTLSDGTHHLFSEYKGKVLILDFYATWCKPCRTSIPHFIGLQNKYGSQGLQVIGLNVGGEEDIEKVPAFAKELGIQYPLAIPDQELVTFLLSDIDAIPQTFIFDREGKLADRVIGFGPSAAATIDEVVERALETSAP